MSPHGRSGEPRERVVEAGGVGLACLEYGDPRRSPLVLVHGIRDHAWSFDPIARDLADAYRVLAPHLRGHGDSDRPGSYAMADFIADLHRLVGALRLERPVLVGHSLGGHIVTQYAGLFRDVPAAVVTVEGLGPPRREAEATIEGRRRMQRERIEALAVGPVPHEPLPDLAAAVERFQRRNSALAPERARLLVERGTEPHPEGGLRWKWVPETQNVWSTVVRDEERERWSWIACPVLVVSGAESMRYWTWRGLAEPMSEERVAADLREKLACFADVESATIEGAGHMVHYDRPDALAAVVNGFLERRLA